MIYIRKGEVLKIESAIGIDEADLPVNWRNFEHGQIISIGDRFLKMKVDQGIVQLHFSNIDRYELAGIRRIHPPSYYLRNK